MNCIRKIESELPRVLRTDRHILTREILRLKRSDSDALNSEKMKKQIFYLEKQIRASIQKKIQRKKHLDALLDKAEARLPDLPILARKADIVKAISDHNTVIISGETGSGKTTQIPKFCLAAGRGIEGRIGCTQPRRIAATTVALRIAEELGEPIGKSVGYKIRFNERVGEDSFIKIMTDGILLAETRNDPYLNEYDTLIVDEAHERSLNIDFVLGILKTLLKKRKDLKLIITSATIDTEKFSKAFDNAPIIEVSGRTYPVELRYFPAAELTGNEDDEQTHVELAAAAVHRLYQERKSRGDMLVFMPTEQDIRETCEILEGMSKDSKISPDTHILPLYARLSANEQARVFSPIPGRKIIVATNVAETSLTIPGIRYVIDTGLARISQYTPGSRTTALPVVPISKSSADQRKGRCGRVENGICIRLFSEEDFDSRPLFTPPEILRSNLAEVILRMIALNLGDISEFPFIDRPSPKHIKDGFDLLTELGAIVAAHDRKKAGNRFVLTEKGKLMAGMPLDPRLSRMLIEARIHRCLHAMMVIVSALSIQDPRERPLEKQAEADQAHGKFKDNSSDFITLLNIWNAYHSMRENVKSSGKMKKFCIQQFLSYRRMREWCDIRGQIVEELKNAGIEDVNPDASVPLPFDYDGIHKAILSGFLSNIALKKEKNCFQGAKDKEIFIFPGSGLSANPGTWVVAAEFIETSRLFARTAANIEVRWLEPLGKDQCRYTYSNPHWERNRGEVTATEQVSLYGLVIDRRSVSYGRISPEESSDIFIYNALIAGDVKRLFPFMQHNRNLVDDIRDMENRIRRRDLLAGEDAMYRFYKKRLENVFDIRTLEFMLKKKGGDEFLRMTKADLFLYSPDEKELTLYPDTIDIGDKRLDCKYNFDPGKADDGVTVNIPSAIAPLIPAERLEWLVPGLLREKIIALLKGLPKIYRKKLVPVADTANLIIGKIQPDSEKSLITSLGSFIYNHFGIDIPGPAWPADTLPDHLKMRISLRGPEGEELRSGRDRGILSDPVRVNIDSAEFESAGRFWEKTGLTRWDFGDLPETVTLEGKNGRKWIAYPGLEPDDSGLRLRLFPDKNRADASHQTGVAKLFALHFSNDLKFLKKNLVMSGEARHYADAFGGRAVFEKRLYDSIISDLFCRNIRTEKEFYAYSESAGHEILPYGKKKTDSVIRVLKTYHEAGSAFYDLEKKNRSLVFFLDELRAELSRLVPESFAALYDTERMVHIERYIKSMVIRAERGFTDFEKDRIKAAEVKAYAENLNRLLKELSPSASEEKRSAIENFFWLLEEYKVSVFAQELKTSVPISKKRLDKKLKEIERML